MEIKSIFDEIKRQILSVNLCQSFLVDKTGNITVLK
jgi:hypothetical protein